MNIATRVLVVVVAMVSVSCGGGSSTGTPTTPTAALTATIVAPSLAAEINSSFKGAMRAGVAVASSHSGGASWLLTMIADQVVAPVHAQGGFVANCSRGGTVRVAYFGPAPEGGRVQLSSTPVTYTGCTHSLNGRDVRASGTLTGNGTWAASAPDSPVRLSGDLNVEGLGTIAIDGTTGVIFGGAIGGISTGNPDTPPPPNPTTTITTTTTTTTTSATTTIPATTTVPASTTTSVASTTTSSVPAVTTIPGAINVTGSWTVPGSAGAMVLTQNGSAISGTMPTVPTPGATIVTNTVSGSISGSTVTLIAVLAIRTSADTASITSTATTNYSLQATNSTMTGSVSGSVVTSCLGSQFCPPSSTTPIPSSSVTFRKS